MGLYVMKKFKKEDVGTVWKSLAGKDYLITGTFKYNGSRFFVGKMQHTNIHEVWWNTGNCACSGKNKLSLNSIIKL